MCLGGDRVGLAGHPGSKRGSDRGRVDRHAIQERAPDSLGAHYGRLAPHARWRRRIVPGLDSQTLDRGPSPEGARRASEDDPTGRPPHTRHWRWADPLRRAFDMGVLACPVCGNRMPQLATLEDPRVVWCRSSPVPPIHLPSQQTSSRTRSPDPQSVGLSSAVGLDTPADAAVCLRPCAALSVAFFRCSWRGVSPSLRTSVVLSLTALLIVAGCSRSPEAKKARHLERGDRYFSKEQYREAILEYRNVLQIERTNPVAIRQIGLAHYQLGEPGQAFGFLLKSKELDPNNIEVRLKLGTMYLVARQQDRAHEEAAFLVEKDPKSLDALALLAGAANEPKEVDAAIRRLETAQGAVGKRTKLQLALAGLHLRKRDLAGAERALKEAVTAEPKSFEAHLALGEC